MDAHARQALEAVLQYTESDAMAELRNLHREQLAMSFEDHRSARERDREHRFRLAFERADFSRALAAVLVHHHMEINESISRRTTGGDAMAGALQIVGSDDEMRTLLDSHVNEYIDPSELDDLWSVVDENFNESNESDEDL